MKSDNRSAPGTAVDTAAEPSVTFSDNTTVTSAATATTTTDAVIEELKALAKSMLDATNAARRRAHTLESRRSYEALMNAIDGRGSLEDSTTAASVVAAAPNAAMADTTRTAAAVPTLAAAAPAKASSAHSAPPVAVAQQKGGGGNLGSATGVPATVSTTSRHVDPFTAATIATAAAGAEGVEDVPAALSPSHITTAASGHVSGGMNAPHGHGDRAEPSISSTAAAAAAVDEAPAPSRPAGGGPRRHDIRPSPSPSAGGTGGANDDDNIYDGVRTQVFFRSTDPKSYADIAASAWKPERLLRSADGATLPNDSDDDDEDKERDSSGSSGSSSPSDYEDGGVAHMGTRNRPTMRAPKRHQRVYRVPAFPFGGGVTESEAWRLSQTFTQCIRNTARSNNSSSHSNAAAAIPRMVTKSEFDSSTYGEVASNADARERAFKPLSPYEFVVEVERPVVFDAVHAREHRRREFRRLVKAGQAPVTMGTFNLRVIMDPIKTGFEDEKHFPIVRGSIVADRYQIVQLLGKATFSRAVRCYDLHQPIYDDDEEEDEAADDEEEQESEGNKKATPAKDGDGASVVAGSTKREKKERTPIGYVEICLKIINNTKDFFDQSLDEIRLLTLINTHKDPDEAHVIRLIDAFYYKEHTMLVTELLSDNLYEYSKYNREEEDEPYFTLPRLRRIARQITEALAYVHSLSLIHADLKPENILFVSHRRCIVKVIDFGSSCFLSDHLSSYIQSRSYRAPEVVLGCDYDGRIDIWSLGAILVELVTGDVLFTSETVPEMLARIVYVCGQPFPRRVLWEGRHTCSFINKFGLIYESSSSKDANAAVEGGRGAGEDGSGAEEPYYVYTPVPDYPVKGASSCKNTSGKREPYGVLRQKLAAAGMHDEQFYAFVRACLTLDHKKRPTSAELLSHPFIADEKL